MLSFAASVCLTIILVSILVQIGGANHISLTIDLQHDEGLSNMAITAGVH